MLLSFFIMTTSQITQEERIIIILCNKEKKTDTYLDLVWITKEQGPIKIGDMKRSHVQNSLSWCIRKNMGTDDEKDGIRYSQWISYFVARLLDPNLE